LLLAAVNEKAGVLMVKFRNTLSDLKYKPEEWYLNTAWSKPKACPAL